MTITAKSGKKEQANDAGKIQKPQKTHHAPMSLEELNSAVRARIQDLELSHKPHSQFSGELK